MTFTATKPKRPWWKRWLFRTLLAVLMIGAMEILVYCGVWIIDGKRFSRGQMQRERDSLTLPDQTDQRHHQYSQIVHPFTGYVYDTTKSDRFSTFGYRDVAPPLHRKASGKLIVALFGGSVGMQFGGEGIRRLTERLHELPALRDKEIVPVRLAVDGYKQPQQFATLAYLLALGGQFDIVINIDGFNDVALHPAEGAPRNVFHAFPRGWPARTGDILPPEVRQLATRKAGIQENRRRNALRFSAAPWRNSYTANLIWRLLDQSAAREAAEVDLQILRVAPAEGELGFQQTGPPEHFADDQQMYQRLIELWQNSSTQMHRLCEANGIRYFHFLQPNQYVPGSKPMGDDERAVALIDNHPYKPSVEAAYPMLVEAGKTMAKSGVRFFDLTRIYADRSEAVYIDSCCHFNPHGLSLMADAVFDAMRPALEQP